MYETFDHTADLGLRVVAPDLDSLFAEAGLALFAVLVEDPASIRPDHAVSVALDGDDRDFLLFDWLRELLFRFDSGHWLFGRFDVHVTPHGLQATAWGEPLDETRHALAHEVKAITYHGLRLDQTPEGWLAEVIVDI